MTIPSSVTNIGGYAFYYCYNLTSLTLSTSLTSIGDWAFYYCYNLTSVTIPSSVTNIGGYAFYYCSQLTGAYFYGNAPMMGAGVFDGCASGFTVYYLDGVMGFSNPWYGYPTAVIARQDGDYRYTVTDGNATITGYTGAGGEISIPATLGGYPTVAIGDSVFRIMAV